MLWTAFGADQPNEQSSENKVAHLVETYAGLLESNFENFAIFKDNYVDFFNSKILNQKYHSEGLAKTVYFSICQFLSYGYNLPDGLYGRRTEELLRQLYEKYPDCFPSFPSFDLMISYIECKSIILERNDLRMYDAYLSSPEYFYEFINYSTLKVFDLLSTLLTVEDVDQAFIDIMKPYCEMQHEYLEWPSQEDLWKLFIEEMKAQITYNILGENQSLLLLLKSKKHKKVFLEKVKKYQTPELVKGILTLASSISAPPKALILNLTDFKQPLLCSESESNSSANAGLNIMNLPTEVLVLIFKECMSMNWFHSVLVCPVVCKRFNSVLSLSDTENCGKWLSISETVAKRFITDTIISTNFVSNGDQFDLATEDFKLASPGRWQNHVPICAGNHLPFRVVHSKGSLRGIHSRIPRARRL